MVIRHEVSIAVRKDVSYRESGNEGLSEYEETRMRRTGSGRGPRFGVSGLVINGVAVGTLGHIEYPLVILRGLIRGKRGVRNGV
jgi:hypothetical protein